MKRLTNCSVVYNSCSLQVFVDFLSFACAPRVSSDTHLVSPTSSFNISAYSCITFISTRMTDTEAWKNDIAYLNNVHNEQNYTITEPCKTLNNITTSLRYRITSSSKIDSVDCCWTTKIDCPPWIGISSRYHTGRCIVLDSSGFTIAVIGKIGFKAAIVVTEHTALISRSVQCCVVRWQCRQCYRYCTRRCITLATSQLLQNKRCNYSKTNKKTMTSW